MNKRAAYTILNSVVSGEGIEIRTLDGKTYTWMKPGMMIDFSEDGMTAEVLVIAMPGEQTTYIAVDHIVVLNVVHDPKKVYASRASQPPARV